MGLIYSGRLEPVFSHLLLGAAVFLGVAIQPGLSFTQYDPDVKVESARLYGNMNQYAYYFVDLLVGSPDPQRTSVIVDTGSRLVGFPCSGCKHCGEHLDPAFDFHKSSSAEWLGCESMCPTQCFKGHCPYQETYSEGSRIAGFWFEDLVELGDAFQKNPPVRAYMGCHTNENKLFFTQRANGIMGLAPSSATRRPTFLEDLFRDKKHIDTAIFSLCLGQWGGQMNVGGYNSSYHVVDDLDEEGGAVQWIGMSPSHYYFVFPESLTAQVGGNKTLVATGQEAFGVTIVDSGTTYTYFPKGIFEAVVRYLDEYCKQHDDCGGQREGDCWRLADLEGPTRFPMLSFRFAGGTEIKWPPRNYLHQRGEARLWCQCFLENNIAQTVLGMSWMLHRDLIFDVGKERLGIAAANCPEHRAQPELLEEFAELRHPIRTVFPPASFATDGPSRGSPDKDLHYHFYAEVLLVTVALMTWVTAASCLAWRARRRIWEAHCESLRLLNPFPHRGERGEQVKLACSSEESNGCVTNALE